MMPINQLRSQAQAQHHSATCTDSIPAFCYQALDSTNCIRLLKIEPSKGSDDQLICNLYAIEIGQTSGYNALSYMWGSKGIQRLITLNGYRFTIGQNLHNALCYMRNQKRELEFWVDAICINQEDIPERNHQLQIMHQIYLRARTVVVWLGDQDPVTRTMGGIESQQFQYPPASQIDAGDAPLAQDPASQEPNHTVIQQSQLQLAERLYKDDYWHRLWIIQEVAQADQLEVCFDNSSPLQWDSFISFIKMHRVGRGGPLRLQRLRKKMNADGCNLRSLLMDHKEAKCEEPRDKIYGLVGLATDTKKFPAMDYSKSLIEVWTDVMHFMNQHSKISESEIIHFGVLVKFLLTGKDNIAVQPILRPDEHTGNQSIYAVGSVDPKAFKINGFVVGSIMHIGPSIGNIVADFKSVDAWEGKIQENYPRDLGRASSESNKLLHAIFRSSQTRTCFNHVSNLQWVAKLPSRPLKTSAANRLVESVLNHYLRTNSNIRNDEEGRCATSVDFVHNESHLIQLQSRNRAKSCNMGVASSHAKKGDLIVWVPEISHAVVVRPHIQSSPPTSSVRLQVYGTALLAEDVARKQIDNGQRLEYNDDQDSLTIQMDAATIFVLLAGDDGL